MTPKVPVPARLWVYLARSAPVGVILRRGPKEWVQMIHWDTKNDIFTPGHWMKGHILERRGGLSPDGKLFIYTVSLPSAKLYAPGYHLKLDYGSAWTAISKPPYFTALALWPNNFDGGFFVDNRTVYVGSWVTHPDHEPVGLKVIPINVLPNFEGTDWFLRNGWTKLFIASQDVLIQNNQTYRSDPPYDMWQKDLDDFEYSLYVKDLKDIRYRKQKPAKRQGRRRDDYLEYGVIDRQTNQEAAFRDIWWADFDQQKRLVLAKAGKLFSATVVDGELSLTALADFNANQPEAIESPDWAKHW